MRTSAARIPGDEASVSVLVRVEPAEAFRIFTEDIDKWWRSGLRYRVGGKHRSILHLEPHVGGRLFESFEGPAGSKVVETGRVTAWDPPRRLVFQWRAVNFAPSESTEVEVEFLESPSGTQVTVRHRGWSQIRPDHPARHDLPVPAFIRMIALWWADLATALREYTEQGKQS